METRHRLSTVGGPRALRLWRAALYLLSSGLLDSGRGAHRDLSLDTGREHLHLDRAGGCGRVRVSAGAAMA